MTEHKHAVVLEHAPTGTAVRGVCTCGAFRSPWATVGPPWPDAPPRPLTAAVAIVTRAADHHLRTQRLST